MPTFAVASTYIASKAIEVLEGQVKKAVVETGIAALPQSRANKAFAEMIDQDIPLENNAILKELRSMMAKVLEPFDYSAVPENERPTDADIVSALVDLGEATWRTRGHRKREILAAAFRAGFCPEYFASGMAKHLWQIASQVEYPEIRLLNKLLDEHETGTRFKVTTHDRNFYFIKRLSELGLVMFHEKPDVMVQFVALSEMAVTFRDFLLAGDYVFTEEAETRP